MKKNVFLLIAAGAMSIAALCFASRNIPHMLNKAEESSYVLTLDLKNHLSDSTSEVVTEAVYTKQGSPITFIHENISTTLNGMNVINENGYFYNKTAISGIKSMTFVFASENMGVNLCAKYFDDDFKFVASLESTTENKTISYDFSAVPIDYFGVAYLNTTTIVQSISIQYSCHSEIDTSSFDENIKYVYEEDHFVVTGLKNRNATSANISKFYYDSYYGAAPVTKIDESAFYGCEFLESINIPEGITLICESAFDGCYSLTSITIPSSVITIELSAFEGCFSLASVTFQSGLQAIGESAFCDCDSLTSITIPSTVTSIGSWAFCSCDSLNSIYIPSSVVTIGENAFSECDNPTICCAATSKPDGWNSNWTDVEALWGQTINI